MEVLEDRIAKFLAVSNGFGNGKGSGHGLGEGNGLDRDFGLGYGIGTGSGEGNGCGNGLGNGYGLDRDFGLGYGIGTGSGYGNGCGSGYGYGIGTGSGYGNGCGNGCGYGNGYGLNSINGQSVNLVDDIPTIITQVRGNLAKGYTLRGNVIKVPCHIAKYGNYFAHGKTAKEAKADAKAKYDRNRPIGERIEDFVKAYPSLDSIAKHEDLFEWHNVLTGSCKFGREEFCKAKGLDPNNGEMSVRTFIGLTIDNYGGDNIQKLLYRYDNNIKKQSYDKVQNKSTRDARWQKSLLAYGQETLVVLLGQHSEK